jgi:hypothetical protein
VSLDQNEMESLPKRRFERQKWLFNCSYKPIAPHKTPEVGVCRENLEEPLAFSFGWVVGGGILPISGDEAAA